MEDEHDPCPVCTGPLLPLGTLGRLQYVRCRDCGMDCAHDPDKEAILAHPDDGWAGV